MAHSIILKIKYRFIMKFFIFLSIAFLSNNSVSAEVVGYWDQGWERVMPPDKADLSIGFMGYSDVSKAIKDNEKLINRMIGQKFLAIGGGNAKGRFTPQAIVKVTEAIEQDKFNGYEGVAFDIEVCEGKHLISFFNEAFSAAKRKKLKILVTISHSEPYACDNSENLMMAIIANQDIDIISPQLYTTGQEKRNNYISIGTDWGIYQKTKAKVLPSIVHPSLYPEAKQFFFSQGVKVRGFIKWAN